MAVGGQTGIGTNENPVGERLREIRKYYRKSQRDMAAALGIGIITWQNYERGVNLPKISTLSKLADIDVNWILTGRGKMLKSFETTGSGDSVGEEYPARKAPPALDHNAIFHLLLNELRAIYAGSDLPGRGDDHLAAKASGATFQIMSVAESESDAHKMCVFFIEQERAQAAADKR
jgi:transcriptional regulator with XRE-family HTH domain